MGTRTVTNWFSVRKELPPKSRFMVTVMSFLLPILLWSLVSYVPWLWHPKVEISDPGAITYFKQGMLVDSELFDEEILKLEATGKALPEGRPVNPVYLPAPHEVAVAFYTAFTTEPKRRSEKWLHESLWQSIQVMCWGFFVASLVGVPRGILAGTYDFFSRRFLPFI